MRRIYLAALASLALVACGSEDEQSQAMNGAPAAGMPQAGLPTAGAPLAGAPTAGTPQAGAPAAGMPQAGTPVAGMPQAGEPQAGTSGTPATGGASGAPAMPGPSVPARDYFPTDAWQSRDPAEVGLDDGMLDAAFDYAQQSATQALLVIRGGYIAREEYYRDFGQEQRHESYSMAKSFTSGLVGIAIDEGLLAGVDERICTYYDAWDCTDDADARSRVTLAHAMTLTTGLEWQEDWSAGLGAPNDAVTMSGSGRPIDYVLAKASAYEPGTHFQYSTGDPALLSGVLESVTGMTALAYARTKVFETIGIGGVQWNSDNDRHTTTYAGLSATAREFAKYGFLYLNRGRWDGEQVVPEAWVEVSTSPGQGLEEWYGYLWHVNAPVKWDDAALPADAFAAIGVQGQHVMVVPSSDLVVVRLAADGFGGDSGFDAGVLLGHVLAAVQ